MHPPLFRAGTLRHSTRLAAILGLALVLSSAGWGQTSRGTVLGTVADSSGAVVQGAEVTLTNQDTAISRITKTNDSGVYRFDAVDLGRYRIAVRAAGFAGSTRDGIVVQAARESEISFSLMAGGASEVVDVVATGAEVLQTTEPLRGRNIESKALSNLPLVGLNSLNLLTVVPGVVQTDMGGSLDSGIGSVNGARPRSNNFMIDGVENNDISVAGPAIDITNPDAIQEVSVQTSNFSAEFGRSGGAVVNQITKSGTNSLHGTATWVYEYQGFNATNREEREGATPGEDPKAKYKEHTPSFTLGGPVVIPGLYNGRNRTFWFVGGQWDRFATGASQRLVTVPTAAGRAVLESLAASCPNARRYLDLIGDTVASAASGQISLEVPQNVFDSTGSCNGTIRSGMLVDIGSATRSAPALQTANNHQVRIDHQLNSSHFLSGRWLYTESAAPRFNGGLGVASFADADSTDRSMSGLFSHTWVISDRATNEFRFNYGRINPQFPLSEGDHPLALHPVINITNLTSVGTSSSFPQGRTANNYQYQDTMTLLRGKHTLRFGVDILRQLARQSAPVNARGTVSYRDSVAVAGVANTGPVSALANFLDDISGPGSGPAARQFGSPVYYPNLFRHSYFVQDDWKLAPNFTLNYGVRYENFGQPANIFPFPAVTLDPAQFAVENEVEVDKNNFGPSIGFAWSPNVDSGFASWLFGGSGKGVLRGGFQVTYDTFFNNLLSNMAAGNPNNASNLPVSNSISTTNPRGVTGLLGGILPGLTAAPLNPRTDAASQYGADMRNPYVMRYSLGMQRELPGNMILDLSYVGSQGRKLFINRELNPRLPNATFTSTRPATTTDTGRLLPGIGARQPRLSAGNSNFNSLQVDLRRAPRRTPLGEISGAFSYTWSKTMDYGASEVFVTSSAITSVSSARLVTLLENPRLDYGISDLHRAHRLVGTLVWDIAGPSNGVLGQVLGGWSLASVLPIQSGTPFTVGNGVDRDLDGSSLSDRPDVGNPNAPLTSRATTVATSVCATGLQDLVSGGCVTANEVRWIQVTGYSLPGANTARRNSAITEWSKLVNLNVIKRFRITEGTRLEYRAEIFNLLNHENRNYSPDGPSADQLYLTAPGSSFLQFNENGFSTSQASRTMRMAVRLSF